MLQHHGGGAGAGRSAAQLHVGWRGYMVWAPSEVGQWTRDGGRACGGRFGHERSNLVRHPWNNDWLTGLIRDFGVSLINEGLEVEG